MNIKLAVVGGGSVNWMRILMKDFYLAENINGGEIRLIDPQQDDVELVASLLKFYNIEQQKSYKIIIASTLEEGLAGVDFVITTFSPGSMDAFMHDLEIPVKYGIRLPVSMTVGAGGISAALRTVPVCYELVEKMEKWCPGAWLLNVTNPMSCVTKALNLAARTVKVVGLCHEFTAFREILGKVIPELAKSKDLMSDDEYFYEYLTECDFDYTVAGINHFIFLTQAKYQGNDVLPRFREYCSSALANEINVKYTICQNFGYLPIPGDRHLVEFLANLCNPLNGYGMKYNVAKTFVDARRLVKMGQRAEIKAIVSKEQAVSWQKSSEQLVTILESIVFDKTCNAIVNLPNQGQIENLPAGAIVETFAELRDGKFTPRKSGKLPAPIDSITRLHIDVQELTVQAALAGDRNKLINALSIDPISGLADFQEIPKMAEELLVANKAHLPRFFN
ncbi:MAG: hypothetical protein L3J71_06905 [Victivallaceae bacterium]|nr:hypothetical protein [Victivallaceae bacterium]